MKKRFLVLTIIIIAGLVAGWQYYSNAAATPEETVTISEVKAKTDDLIIDFLSDGVVTMNTYEIAFLSSGTINTLTASLGDTVEKGDLLATLDHRELTLKKLQAEGDLQSAQEKINQTTVDQKESLAIESATLSYLQKELSHEKDTLVSMNTYPSLYTRSDFDAQQAKIDDTANRVTLEQLKINSIKEDTSLSDSLTIQGLDINLQLIDLDLAHTELLSPTDGVVVDIRSGLGTYVGTTSPYIVLQDQSQPFITSMVSEMDVHQVTIGQKVLVEFESDFGIPYEGNVRYVSSIPTIDNNGIVSYEVTIDLIRYHETLRAGLTTMLNFVLKERLDAVIIPNSAVTLDGTTQFVEVKTETASEMRQIMTGLTDGTSVEVIDGLIPGEVVLIRSSN